jgi:hypothetical protein
LAAASAIAAILLFFGAQRLLSPKYMDGIYEGAMTTEYYNEKLPHDVIFVGDCEVYDNLSTIALWEDYGLASYIRGGPNQLAWQSSYLLEEAVLREKPEVAVYSVLALHQGEPESEAYNRLNLDSMRPSLRKLSAVMDSMLPGESVMSYFFPIFRYHDRWLELSAIDLEHFLKPDKVSFKGYMMRADVLPADVIPRGRRLSDYTLPERSMEHLAKMAQLCKREGVELLLIKAPSVYPYWYPEWDAQIKEFASINSLEYLNLIDLSDEIGLDLTKDTYDAGLHLNVYGAEKAARYLGRFLVERYSLKGHRGESDYEREWNAAASDYHALKALQEEEFARDRKISTYKYE